MKNRKLMIAIFSLIIAATFVGCIIAEGSTSTETVIDESTVYIAEYTSVSQSNDAMFTERDLEQEADLTDTIYMSLESGQDITITEEGVYVLQGFATDVTVIVEADDDAKVQLVLDEVIIENSSSPTIYIKSGDKVFITTTNSESSLSVTSSFEADGDAVIYSKSDLVLNGTGTLNILSATGNGITSKDDLKVTGGTFVIDSEADALEANDSIRIYDGDITITTNKDALHSENDEDSSLGYVYIEGGSLTISAADDAIRGTTYVQIDGGTIDIETCSEGIEATTVQINGGVIDIYATDDGINATAKSSYDVLIEVNGGIITVDMANGDTDGFDSNGSIIINGGNIDVTATSSFDADVSAELNGGEVTVNGQQITEIVMTMMGGQKKR